MVNADLPYVEKRWITRAARPLLVIPLLATVVGAVAADAERSSLFHVMVFLALQAAALLLVFTVGPGGKHVRVDQEGLTVHKRHVPAAMVGSVWIHEAVPSVRGMFTGRYRRRPAHNVNYSFGTPSPAIVVEDLTPGADRPMVAFTADRAVHVHDLLQTFPNARVGMETRDELARLREAGRW